MVDSYTVQWDRNHTQFATFHDTLSPRTTNYTVTGLSDYENAVFSISVTASNAVGSATSPSMNIVANFASANEPSTDTETSSSSSQDNESLIIGVVVAGLVILAVVVVIVALLVYHYKSKPSENNPVYS